MYCACTPACPKNFTSNDEVPKINSDLDCMCVCVFVGRILRPLDIRTCSHLFMRVANTTEFTVPGVPRNQKVLFGGVGICPSNHVNRLKAKGSQMGLGSYLAAGKLDAIFRAPKIIRNTLRPVPCNFRSFLTLVFGFWSQPKQELC